LENDKIENVITDKAKMDELMKLLEELVINKIRIEKINQELKNKEFKKVLDQETLIVSKVQEVVKKIQTSAIKVVYKKLLDELSKQGKNTENYHLLGEKAEFDNNLENPIFNMLKSTLEIFESAKKDGIMINAVNNSSSIIIEISNCEDRGETQRDIYNSGHLSLAYAGEEELSQWLLKTSLTGSLNVFQNIKNISRTVNASVDLECEKDELGKITLSVPYSSSITKAQFIKLSNQTFAIPVEYIDKILNINAVKTEKSNGKDFIKYMDHIIPIILIEKKLEMTIEEDFTSYIVLNNNEQMKAMPVNAILEQSDIVVKPKPQAISEISEYKGTAILEDGNVTIVLDVPSLVQVKA
jgi:two-component system chemotaxis sensor kinase CheA